MATYYIDFDSGVDDPGRDGLSEAQAWQTFEYIVTRSAAAAGNRYLCKGTRTGQYTINSAFSGAQGQMTYFGRYGTGPNPVVISVASANNNACLNISNLQWITIEDFDLVGYGTATSSGIGAGIYGSWGSLGNGMVLRRIRVSRTKATGFDISFTNLSAPPTYGMRNLVIDGCRTEYTGFHGFNLTGRVDGAIVTGCTALYSGQITDGYGFSTVSAMTTIGTSGWTNSSGTVYSRALSNPANYSGTPAGVLGVVLGNKNANSGNGYLSLTENTGTPTTPGAGEFGYSAATLYINIGVAPSSVSGFSMKVMVGRCSATFINCRAAYTKRISVEGHGFVADDMSRGVFRGCLAEYNEGGGFTSHKGVGTVIAGNVARFNAAFGVRLLGSDSTIVINNTLISNGPYGVQCSGSADYSGGCVIDNNGIIGHTTAIYSWNAKNTATNNGLFGNTASFADGIASGGGDVTTNPTLNAQSEITASSTWAGAGVTHGPYLDKRGKPLAATPSIGAYEVQSTRPALASARVAVGTARSVLGGNRAARY